MLLEYKNKMVVLDLEVLVYWSSMSDLSNIFHFAIKKYKTASTYTAHARAVVVEQRLTSRSESTQDR